MFQIVITSSNSIARYPNGDAITFKTIDAATDFIAEMYSEMIARMVRGTWTAPLTGLRIVES